jgi:class 3 adenylate cyclase/tetratricopeptide (TPR) repeat protein/energy-coupling factor transporter ATP-binding protein EcfA2
MQQIADWLENLGLGQYAQRFAENDINFSILSDLTDQDLKELGVSSLGHRRQLLRAIAELTSVEKNEPTPAVAAATAVFPQSHDVAERRQVTVMFSDLVGSTALSARIDPEDLREVISVYQKCVAETVQRFGGFVAKYMGDSVLVYFGYPQAHEDDAERAVRAGLELIAAVGGLKSSAPLQTRLGIATGLVVVGDLIGSGEAHERGIIGETPNLAARVQGLAEPNSVAIAESTRKLLGNLFEFEDLGARDLKGIAGPVRAWTALRPSGVESRFEALHASGLTELVGREEELELLLRRWSKAKTGEGQVVLLTGEAGIGKSRLTAALLEKLTGEPHTRLRYFCSPQHTDSALYPVISQMKRAAGFVHDDTAQARLDKLDAELAQTSTSIQEAALFAEMLSLPNDGRYPTLELAPEQRRQKTMEALIAQTEVLTRQNPVLMIFEDAHWTDPTSLGLFDRAVDRIASLRVLLIVIFRPEFAPPWIGRPHVTALTLNRLAEREISAMIDRVVGNKLLPASVRQDIIERTDGVPLFVEEMTKAVLEAESEGAAKRAIGVVPSPVRAVPASLHASLMARLDRLGPAKEAAQVGGAIGREFSYSLLAAVMDEREVELNSALDRLIAAGLLFRQGAPPHATYLFKHALVRDAAYGTLLREPRRALHARIAEALESQFPEIAEHQPEVLAHHFTAAGLAGRAVDWWEKASEHALARSAYVEAANHLARALEILAAQPESKSRDKREFQLRLRLRPPLYATKGFASPEMEENFARASMLAERLGESGANLRLLRWECTASVVSANTTVTLNHTRQFIELAERAGDTSALVSAHRICGYAHLIRGEICVAREHVERALSLREAPCENRQLVEYEFLSEPMTRCIMGLAVQQLGYPDQALNICENALAAAKQEGHQIEIAYVSFHLALLWMVSGDATRVERVVTKLVEFLEQQDIQYWKWHCETLLGWATVKSDSIDVDAGLARMRQGAAGHHRLRVNAWMPFYLTREAEILNLYGRYDTAMLRLDEAKALMVQLEQFYAEPELHRLRAATLSAQGAAGREIDAAFEQALEAARRHQTKLWELRAATSCGEFWREGGRRRQARDLLEPVYGWFTEGFETLDLKKAKAVLESLT